MLVGVSMIVEYLLPDTSASVTLKIVGILMSVQFCFILCIKQNKYIG